MRTDHTAKWRGVAGEEDEVLEDPSSQLAQNLILMKRRNLKQVVDMITGHGHWLKYMQRMGIFADKPTCRKCGQLNIYNK